MAERLALGKGLSALLGDGFDLSGRAKDSVSGSVDETLEKIYSIKIQDIKPDPNQPRQSMDADALESLAESIRTHGILQPLLLRALPSSEAGSGARYQIIAGERRWRAAQLAGLTEAPCRVLTVSEAEVRELALIENVQRRDLTLIEIASALETMIARNGLTQEECAARLGWSRPMVSNRLRLLTLPPDVLEMLATNRLTEGHARTLLGLPEEQRSEVALLAADGAMTVRQLEELVRRRNDPELELAEAEGETEGEAAGNTANAAGRFHTIRLSRPLKDFRKRGIKIRIGHRNGVARVVLDALQGIEDETIMNAIEKCLRELYPEPPVESKSETE